MEELGAKEERNWLYFFIGRDKELSLMNRGPIVSCI